MLTPASGSTTPPRKPRRPRCKPSCLSAHKNTPRARTMRSCARRVFLFMPAPCAGFLRGSAAAFPLINSGRCACIKRSRRAPVPCVPACDVFLVYARACAGFLHRSATAFPLINSGRCACVRRSRRTPEPCVPAHGMFFVYARALRGIFAPQRGCFSTNEQRTLRIAQALHLPFFPHTYTPRPPLRRSSASPSQKSCRRRTALLRQVGIAKPFVQLHSASAKAAALTQRNHPLENP